MNAEKTRLRFSELERKTNETSIKVSVDLDGEGKGAIQTGIGFFDHMLNHVAHHGSFDLTVKAEGDLHVDEHHTIEDVGICLGKAITEALGDKQGIERYGWAALPMDDALVLVSLDFCGRSYLNFDVHFNRERVGEMPTELVQEFFRAVCQHCLLTLHIKQMAGTNAHHVAEAIFKAFGKAIFIATRQKTGKGIPSTKGMIE